MKLKLFFVCMFLLISMSIAYTQNDQTGVSVTILEPPEIMLGDDEYGDDTIDDDGTVWATLTTDPEVESCEINWEGGFINILPGITSANYFYSFNGVKTVYYMCYDSNNNALTVDDSILVGECYTDNECDYLDNDYCDGDLIKHDEGKCVDYVCETEPTMVDDCSLYSTDCDYLDGCIGNDYYDYNDVQQTCDMAMCIDSECGLPTIYTNDPRCVEFEDPDRDGISSDVDNCIFVYNPAQIDTDLDGIGDACEDNIDGDSVPDETDFVEGNESFIDTNIEEVDVIIDSDDNLNQEITGEKHVEFIDDIEKEILVEFDFNFGEVIEGETQKLDFSKITIKKQDESADSGSILISGIDLTLQGKTKDVYLDNINPNKNSVCVKDAEVASIEEISVGCDGEDETLISCPGSNGPYTCLIEGDKYKITGVVHSGAEETYSCVVDNDCNDLDNDYCSGTEIKHDEGKCVDYECTTETTLVEDCNDGLYCNGEESCQDATCAEGTPVDCSGNDLAGIATCFNNPDNIDFTWDYFAGFISACNEAADSCTTGAVSLTHTCNVADCGAECEIDADCSCSNVDVCTDSDNDGVIDDYVDYPDGSCQNDCTCSGCEPVTSTNDERCKTTMGVQLDKGVSMFSLPLQPESPVTFNDIQSGCSFNSPYTGGTGISYVNANTGEYVYIDADAVLYAGQGYFTTQKNDCELTIEGYKFTMDYAGYLGSHNIKKGWNMIGAPSEQVDDFDTVEGNCDVVSGPWGFDAATYEDVRTQTLIPGKGYWIKTTNDCNLG